MEVCATELTSINWNVVQAAGSYAQLSALLAAVVFAGIALLLSNPPEGRGGMTGAGFSNALSTLPVIFVSSILTSHFYTVIEGEQYCQRAFAIHSLAATALALSLLGLLLAISWMFYSYGVANEVLRNSNRMYAFVQIVSLFYLYVTARDADQVLRGDGMSAASVWLIAALLILIPLFATLLRVHGALSLQNRFGDLIVVLFLAEMLLAGLFAFLSDADVIKPGGFPQWWELTPLFIAGATSGILINLLPPSSKQASASTRPARKRKTKHHDSGGD